MFAKTGCQIKPRVFTISPADNALEWAGAIGRRAKTRCSLNRDGLAIRAQSMQSIKAFMASPLRKSSSLRRFRFCCAAALASGVVPGFGSARQAREFGAFYQSTVGSSARGGQCRARGVTILPDQRSCGPDEMPAVPRSSRVPDARRSTAPAMSPPARLRGSIRLRPHATAGGGTIAAHAPDRRWAQPPFECRVLCITMRTRLWRRGRAPVPSVRKTGAVQRKSTAGLSRLECRFNRVLINASNLPVRPSTGSGRMAKCLI